MHLPDWVTPPRKSGMYLELGYHPDPTPDTIAIIRMKIVRGSGLQVGLKIFTAKQSL
jgi:hypothetical protein